MSVVVVDGFLATPFLLEKQLAGLHRKQAGSYAFISYGQSELTSEFTGRIVMPVFGLLHVRQLEFAFHAAMDSKLDWNSGCRIVNYRLTNRPGNKFRTMKQETPPVDIIGTWRKLNELR